jgi:hypothetical protein
MSQYKITKKRLAEIIKEEYEAAMERTDEAHCGTPNRDEPKSKKKPDEDGDGVPDWADKKPGEDDHTDKKVKKESAGDWTKAMMTGDARDAYGVQKTKSGKSDDDKDDKDDKKKKKMKKESLDSIRTLIQQELKNL